MTVLAHLIGFAVGQSLDMNYSGEIVASLEIHVGAHHKHLLEQFRVVLIGCR